MGTEQRAARVWAAAGAAGAAIGPAVGGLLTQLVSWQSIFLVQTPLALMIALTVLPAARNEDRGEAIAAELRRTGRPHGPANLALALVSAGLAAALFLLVLLLIEGWRHSPIVAAMAVTVMPIAALTTGRLAGEAGDARSRAIAGIVALAGGLAGLGLLPKASIPATFPAQVLLGAGLALVLSALTEAALEGRAPQAIHGGWTLAARHAGVVAGLLVLTPIFTADLVHQRQNAEQAGTAALLDAQVSVPVKYDLARRLSDRLAAEDGKVPVIAPAFDPLPSDPADRAGALALKAKLQDQLDRAATHAFSPSFLLAAGFALAALLPITLARRTTL